MEKILVVDDDHAVQRALRCLFEAEDYRIEITGDGPACLQAFHNSPPSLLILDLRLPGISGQDLCRQIKQEAPLLPIIILSATTEVDDKVSLLELGADDYVTKPFSPRELLARARVALRRTAQPAHEWFAFDDVAINFPQMEVVRNGSPVSLTPQEFKILKFLVLHSKRVISREELLNEAWGYSNYPTTRTVDNHIWRLRQKLEKEPTAPVHFCTVHGAGYKFVP